MKYTNVEDIKRIASEISSDNVLIYMTKGSGYYTVDRMTKRYGNLPLRCKMYRGFEKADDGIYWLLQTCNCVKAEYSAQDLWERKMWNENSTNIKDGETYLILNAENPTEMFANTVVAHVNGDYSDAVVFKEA